MGNGNGKPIKEPDRSSINKRDRLKDTVLRRGHELFEMSSPGEQHAKQIAELEQLLRRKEVELAL